ncbi:MAG: TIGR02678 family protein [Caloramator sp.]|nr:TIGR02678 family protein [Caloramator sp.]
MDTLKTLLDNYIIVKEDNKDLYYEIKDNIKNFKSFIQDKLGYDIIVHQDFIKLEKFPGKLEPWMGIRDFKDKLDYCLFILLIMFLEDKGKEDKFVLSQLIDYINSNFEFEKIDWTIYSNRRALVRVLKFAEGLKLIKVFDGEDDSFAESETAEVLYENTGISKYVIRSFPIDISSAKSYKDFISFAWDTIDEQKGITRRHRVYRNIIMSSVMYNEGSEDQDFYYLKNFKPNIESDLEKYLGWKLHVHREAALVGLEENERIEETFPNISAISDIVLCLNKLLLEKLRDNILSLNDNFNIEIDEKCFLELLDELKIKKGEGWSKEFRECSQNYLYSEVFNFMKGFNMIDKINDKIILKPLIAKITGDYPKDFNEGEKKIEG